MWLTNPLLLLLVYPLFCGCSSDTEDVSQEMAIPRVEEGKPDLFAISDSVYARYGKVGYEKLTEAEKVFVCIWGLEGEVNNGGFEQYYFNTSGDHALDAVKSLQAIGANHTATLVSRANGLFGPSGPSHDRDIRWRQLDAFSESARNQLAQFDEEFFEYKGNLKQLLSAFVQKHSLEFQR
jgi:hypothetical protein